MSATAWAGVRDVSNSSHLCWLSTIVKWIQSWSLHYWSNQRLSYTNNSIWLALLCGPSQPTVNKYLHSGNNTTKTPTQHTKKEFLWFSHHQEAFTNIKTYLATSPLLSVFDVTKPTRLSTNPSQQCLGFILQQQTRDEWFLIQAGSWFLSDMETRYDVRN